jgi:hypothetical protein
MGRIREPHFWAHPWQVAIRRWETGCTGAETNFWNLTANELQSQLPFLALLHNNRRSRGGWFQEDYG